MCNIKVANIKTKEFYDLYIGRKNGWLGLEESKWANPFILKKGDTKGSTLEDYERYVRSRPDLIAALPELKDKILGCYCWSDLTNSGHPCHGLVLKKLYKEFVNDK